MPDREPIKVISDSNEQWLYQGDCEKCRRKSYCRKFCKAHKEKLEDDFYKKIAQKTAEITGIVMSKEAIKEFI